MDQDHYHNILSEEFPSPIRNHESLPELLDVQEQAQSETVHQQQQQQQQQHQQQRTTESLVRDIESIPDLHPLGDDDHLDTDNVAGDHDDMLDRRKQGVKVSHLTIEEKKERQKAQNRRAAERARAKRREEVEGLEVIVGQLGEENAKLRARLADLVATRSTAAPPQIPIPPNPPSTKPLDAGVDYNYLSKIQTEIHASKLILLDRELSVAKLRNIVLPDDEGMESARTGLLRQFTKHLYLQSEASALDTMIAQVKTERDEIKKQDEMLRRDIENRKIFSEPTAPQSTEPVDSALEVSVGIGEMEGEGLEEHDEGLGDRSIMDIGGWVDAAWQASGHTDEEMGK